jgi:hypothetical protein
MEGAGCSYHILPDRLYFYPGVRSVEGSGSKGDRLAALLREALYGLYLLLSND